MVAAGSGGGGGGGGGGGLMELTAFSSDEAPSVSVTDAIEEGTCGCANYIGTTWDCKDPLRYFEYKGFAAGGAVPWQNCDDRATKGECHCTDDCDGSNLILNPWTNTYHAHISPGTCKWTPTAAQVLEDAGKSKCAVAPFPWPS